MSKKLKLAMIGAGRMADLHLNVLKDFDNVDIVALANTPQGEERRRDFCERYGVKEAFDDYRTMLKVVKPDAVYICPSILTLFDVAKECLEQGIHCFIEKPPGISVDEAEILCNIARKKKCVHIVGLQRRFYSHILEAKRIINDHGGLVSMVMEASERFKQIKEKAKFPEAVQEKWIFANGIHCLDLFCFLGGPLKDVHAKCQYWEEDIHPDSLQAFVEFENGATGHYYSNWMAPGGWAVTLFAKGCRIEIKPLEFGKVIYSDGTQKDLTILDEDKNYKPGLFAQNKMFVDACLGVGSIGEPAATLSEAITAMRLAEKIMNSK